MMTARRARKRAATKRKQRSAHVQPSYEARKALGFFKEHDISPEHVIATIIAGKPPWMVMCRGRFFELTEAVGVEILSLMEGAMAGAMAASSSSQHRSRKESGEQP